MNDLHSMIMKSIQDAQKQMQDIQLQLKTTSQENKPNENKPNENKPNVIQQMNQSIDLLLKARESLQQFHQQYTNQSQDTVPQEKHENSKPEKIKKSR